MSQQGLAKRSRFRSAGRSARRRWIYLPRILAGFLFGTVVAAGFWTWQHLRDPRTLPFHELRINGRFQHLRVEQMREILQPQIKGGFFSLRLAPLKASLMANPWVEDVAIRRLPGTLSVTVREQQPIARWNDHYLINSDDQLFPAPADAPAGLPQLRGPEDSESEVLTHYKQINALFRSLHLQVQEITWDARQNWELLLNNGVTVTIGRTDVLPRIQHLVHWYGRMADNGAPGQITHIDLRYPNGIAVERR